MSKEQAHAIAATWRAHGYDVRMVSIAGDWAALALREDGQRWYVYAPLPPLAPAPPAPSLYAGSGNGALRTTVETSGGALP
jgi:hypothetical protein